MLDERLPHLYNNGSLLFYEAGLHSMIHTPKLFLTLTLLLATAAHADPTRALFHYRRDDAAPGGVTRIWINTKHTATRPISQNVFGNFIENLGSVIDDILLADTLHNPNLERIEVTDHEAPWWDQTGSASWQEAAGSGYVSQRCVRLSEPNGTLSQRVYLPEYRERHYTLTLWARGEGQATLAIRAGGENEGGGFRAGDEKAGQSIAQTSLAVQGNQWQKQTIHWTLPAGALAKGQAARFVISYAAGDSVDVDQVRLLPDDAVDGTFDPDTIRLAKAWHIPILRFAGNYSSGYHWRDGIGPLEARPTVRNVAWGGVDAHQFGTDEYLDLARLLGAKTQIGVNAGNGTPEEAAAWVRYCNAQTKRVPLWEIGNELYGSWQIGHTDAPGNATRYVKFRDAMLQVDPTLQLMATGKGEEFNPDGLARDQTWNEAVLHAAVAGQGQPPDYLTLHPLVGLPGNLRDFSYEQRYESAMAQPAFLDQTLIPNLIQEITEIEGPNARTRITPTEWGIIIDGAGWERSPNHNAMTGALYNALALNTFLRQSDWVTLANMTALLHGGSIKKDRGVVYADPQYYTQQLYAAARPQTPVQADWTGPGRDVPTRGFLPAVPNVSDIDVFSALTADPHTLVAFVVNRHLTEARPIRLTLQGFTPTGATATVLTSPDPQAVNGWYFPSNVRPQAFALPTQAGETPLNVTLPPHSVVVFTFRR